MRDLKLFAVANRRDRDNLAILERLGYGHALRLDEVSGGEIVLRKSKKL